MLVTITNTSGRVINKLDSYNGATGGVRLDALPFPFGQVTDLAIAGNKQLPMHPSDLGYKTNPNEPFAAWSDFQTAIKRNIISVVIADQLLMSPYGAFDERFMIEVG
jgi:hypothetical protein